MNKNAALHAAVSAALLAFASAEAQAADDSLTWNGITLYGVYDIGVAYQTHGAPLTQEWGVGLAYLIAKNSNKSQTSIAPNGLSQSRLGLKGAEAINDDLSFVFNLEMGFNPQSGKLSDGPASLVHNNGVPLTQQKSAGDSSRAGQLFNGPAFGGLSSKTWGTLTFGRHNTVQLDAINKYDPMNQSYAFSVIGLSGTASGGGYTQDARLDDTVKYSYKYGIFHAGALYQFGKSDAGQGEAWQAGVGIDRGGFSIDGVYARKKDGLSAASLSAEQLKTLPADTLAATISDNTAYTLGASYTTGPFKVSGGYEHIEFENPSQPLEPGFTSIGGYTYSVVNNKAFPHVKKLDVSWIGLKYLITRDLDITGAFYHYDQNAYGAKHCSDRSSATCSGQLDAYSVRLDYRLNKRFDVYAGAMFSRVSDGLAAGYLHTFTLDPMVGFRFQF